MAMAPASRSSSSPKPPERTTMAGIPAFFAASTSHTESPTITLGAPGGAPSFFCATCSRSEALMPGHYPASPCQTARGPASTAATRSINQESQQAWMNSSAWLTLPPCGSAWPAVSDALIFAAPDLVSGPSRLPGDWRPSPVTTAEQRPAVDEDHRPTRAAGVVNVQLGVLEQAVVRGDLGHARRATRTVP